MSDKKQLGQLLVESGLINETQLKAALLEQQTWGGRLGSHLVNMGMISEEQLVEAVSQQLNITKIDLRKSPVFDEALQLLDKRICQKHGILPVVFKMSRNQRQLLLAMSDPTNFDALKEVEFMTSSRVVPVVAPESMIMRAIDYCYRSEGVRSKGLNQYLNQQQPFTEEPMKILGVQEFVPPPDRPTISPTIPPTSPIAEAVEAPRSTRAQKDPVLLALIELLIEKGFITRREIEVKLAKYSSK